MHESESAGFLVWALPEVQNLFRNQLFQIKSNIIIILNLFFGAFCLKKWRLKKWIFHCIFKMGFGRGRVYFLTIKNSEKAKHTKICLRFSGNMPQAQN